MDEIKILQQTELLDHVLVVYGTVEKPLFLARDVAEWIEYNQNQAGSYDVSQMLDMVDADEKIKIFCTISNMYNVPKPSEPNSYNGANRWFLTEDGVYEVLMQSQKPIAGQFKKGVKEILKSIRKNGMYATDDTIDKILNDPDYGIRLLTRLKEERKKRIEYETKVAILTHTNKTYTCTEIAKELGLQSAHELNKILHDKGIQYKQNNTRVPYSRYADLAWFDIKQEVLDNGHIIYHRRITGIGREAILDIIKNNNIHLMKLDSSINANNLPHPAGKS